MHARGLCHIEISPLGIEATVLHNSKMSPRDPELTRDPEADKGPPCNLPIKPAPLILISNDVRTPKHTITL